MKIRTLLAVLAILPLFLPVHADASASAAAVKVYQKPVPGEAQALGKLTPRTGWEFARKLISGGSNTDGLGFRYAGTPSGRDASRRVFDAFKKLGLKPVYDEFPVLGWNYKRASLTVQATQKMSIPVTALHGTPPTPSRGLSAPVVFVGSAAKQDLEGKDLSGKIALVEADLEAVPWYTEAADQCRRRGAAAVVFFNKSYFGKTPNGEAFWTFDLSGVRLDIPVLNTPVNDGRKLKEVLLSSKAEPVTGTLISEAEIIPDAHGRNVIGRIKGSRCPDEYIIISAHTDAHFYGFQDDALPVGLLVTMAKAMKESRYKPDRTLLFIAFDSEECGRVGTHYSWLAGSWHYAKKYAKALEGKVVGHVNLELLAAKDKDYFAIRSSDTLFTFVDAVSKTIDLKGHSRNHGAINGINTWNDEWCLSYFGVPTLTTNFQYQLAAKPEEINIIDYYHSQFDDEAHASFEKYADGARAYTSVVVRMDRLPLNPYDLSVTPVRYIAALNQEALKKQGYGDGLKKAAESFAAKAKELRDKQLQLAGLYDSAAKSRKTAVKDLIVQYNRALRRAAKTVIMGTQYLDWDIPAYQAAYYQEMPLQLARAMEELRKGDGKAMLDNFSFCGSSAYYARFLDYSVWKDAYRESIEAETSKGDLHWGTGRVLKYYDVYPTLERIRTKTAAGERDFTAEIDDLAKIKSDVEERLKKAVLEDTAVWKKAQSELPLQLADRMLRLLR